MKNYEKPIIEEELIELEDVIAASIGGETDKGVEVDFPFSE